MNQQPKLTLAWRLHTGLWERDEDFARLQAHLRVNGKEYSCPVTEGLSGAEISAALDAGPATLQAWFVERDQATKAVYSIDVERKDSK